MAKRPAAKSHGAGKLCLLLLLSAVLAFLIALCFRLERSKQEAAPETQDSGMSATQLPETLPTESQTAPSEQASTDSASLSFPIALGQGLYLTDIGKFAGIYVEDGSDEPVSDLLMVQITNKSGKDLYLASITITFADRTAEFQITNLPSGAQAVLLERNRMAYTDEMPTDFHATNISFADSFSMCEEQLRITAHSGVINVENISGQDISQDIFVYYKNYSGDLYFGGITYRIRIGGGLKAGEIRQLAASHYYDSGSQLLMVSIGG